MGTKSGVTVAAYTWEDATMAFTTARGVPLLIRRRMDQARYWPLRRFGKDNPPFQIWSSRHGNLPLQSEGVLLALGISPTVVLGCPGSMAVPPAVATYLWKMPSTPFSVR